MGISVIALGLLRVPARRTGAAHLAASASLALEFFLPAGLLRLSSIGDFAALGIVAAIIFVRKLIAAGIRYALGALGQTGLRSLRAD